MNAVLNWVRRVFQIEHTRMIQVFSATSDPGTFVGSKKIANFDLGPGRWVIFAKATALAYGGNERRTDLRLKVIGTEHGLTYSDESYGSASPGLGSSMTVMLPIDVISQAQFEVNVGVQLAEAEFKHIVITAIREA